MRKLSEYIARVPRQRLPADVMERAKYHVLDTLAAMVSGAPLLPGRRAIEYVSALGGVPEAGIVGSRVVTSAANTALAMAERNRRNGTALLRAVVLGYDVCARISKTLGIERFRSAGHSTHSYGGTFGAAAAAGALAGINTEQARYLLSYAAQQASGLSCWARDVEHVEKAFDFGGMPARNGVTAATMVASRFTGVEDVFAGDRGFFHAHERYAQPALLVHALGREFDIMQTAIKRWPVGYPIQAPLDALANLMAAHKVAAKDVARVLITLDEQGARTVSGRKMADINIEHLTALMLLDGDITFASSHDARRVRDPVVLMKGRMRVRFSYRDQNGKTVPTWIEQPDLPAAVAIEIFGAQGNPILPVPALIRLPQNFSVECFNPPGNLPNIQVRCTNEDNQGATNDAAAQSSQRQQ